MVRGTWQARGVSGVASARVNFAWISKIKSALFFALRIPVLALTGV